MRLRSILSLAIAGLVACTSTVESEGDTSTSTGTGGATTTSATSSSSGSGAGGEGGGACAPPASAGAFEIGTGERCFEPLVSDQEVPLMQGPQGGYHVWLAVGCNDCPDNPTLVWGALDPATGATLEGTYESQSVVDLSNQSWPQIAGLFTNMPGLSWDPMTYPPPAKGTHVVLYAKLLGSSMETLHEGQVEIVIGDTLVWDPCATDPMNCPDGAGGAFGGGTGGLGGGR
ncbi:MAG: hypothetical protein JNL21_26895 [Myxococcales bacterium]|nr:hypothetical protein [Myxococcales bacterium]